MGPENWYIDCMAVNKHEQIDEKQIPRIIDKAYGYRMFDADPI